MTPEEYTEHLLWRYGVSVDAVALSATREEETDEQIEAWRQPLLAMNVSSDEEFLIKAASAPQPRSAEEVESPMYDFFNMVETILFAVPFKNVEGLLLSWLKDGKSDVLQLAHIQTGTDYMPLVLEEVRHMGSGAVRCASLIFSWGWVDIFDQVTEICYDAKIPFNIKSILIRYYPRLINRRFSSFERCLPVMKRICEDCLDPKERHVLSVDASNGLDRVNFPLANFPEIRSVARLQEYLENGTDETTHGALVAEMAERAHQISLMSRQEIMEFKVWGELGPIRSGWSRSFTEVERDLGYVIAQ